MKRLSNTVVKVCSPPLSIFMLNPSLLLTGLFLMGGNLGLVQSSIISYHPQ